MRHSNPRDPNKASTFFGLPHEKYDKPIKGWRTWNLGEVEYDSIQRYYLKSVAAGINWEGPVMTTNVQPNGKLAPVCINNKAKFGGEGRGDYGVYAYKSLDLMIRNITMGPIIGTVDLSGQGIEHELGYRMQKAVIRKLWIVPVWIGFPTISQLRDISTNLANTYSCEVGIAYPCTGGFLFSEI